MIYQVKSARTACRLLGNNKNGPLARAFCCCQLRDFEDQSSPLKNANRRMRCRNSTQMLAIRLVAMTM